MTAIKLPLGKQIAYAFGMMGWSIMINMIGVILVYFYLPPVGSGLPKLISQAVIFSFFNVVALVTASSRLVDAFIDPFIAQFSDQSKNPKGRRIPFMTWAILPSLLFCCLVFYPLKNSESTVNVFWLIFTLIGFYVSSTTYIIPYNALLPELAPTSEDKVRLSTMQSVGYVFGIGVASNAFNLADIFQRSFQVANRISALQLSVLSMAILAAISMLIPVLMISEKKYCISQPNAVPIKKALSQTLRNKNFLLFLVADFSYFTAITIITSGLMYYVTVLLGLPESIGNKLMITMVIVSFVFYPVVNYLAQKTGKKVLVVFSFGLLSLVFSGIFFLGKIALDTRVQIYSLIAFAAIPFAALNILPNAILAEIIEKDSIETKGNKEAIYFAVRYFFVKIAQTMGIAVFAMLLIYGKDTDNDFGIRLNGLVGFVLCLTAGLIFSKFKSTEKKTS